MTGSPPRWVWVLLGVALLLAFFVSISGILLPFVVGLAVAYLLDPVADRMETWKLPRWLATSIAILLFFGLMIGVFIAIAPMLRDQVVGFLNALPGYVAKVRPLILGLINEAGGTERAQTIVEQSSGKLMEWIGAHVGQLLASGIAFFNVLTLILISPVVAFYLLRDWDIIVARGKTLLPRQHLATIETLLHDMDYALSGFVRGQFLVCMALAVLYAFGWTLLGLNYALVLGLIAGLLAFVPLAGPFFASALALLVALGQFGTDWLKVGLVYVVFVIVQGIEGSILTPNLIGNRVGLHPVWVIFAIFAGGELMGVLGIFLAVPVAAVVAVLSRWLIQRYLASRLYDDGRPVETAPTLRPTEEDAP
ncbi:AI-2E family transporter [Pedomonas mirosovicensis]|uniref:AI-2E family transporter n=1 Tax=Pedomonas mirosovicensis TaxID=2908641 RepID=UPI00216A344E|nr:AI-2E family transporter [Pedomonas mirosovicensis]MCH8685299.1 AI-2E family transporter [Pedomonas mirosovicensis]